MKEKLYIWEIKSFYPITGKTNNLYYFASFPLVNKVSKLTTNLSGKWRVDADASIIICIYQTIKLEAVLTFTYCVHTIHILLKKYL